MPWICTNFEVDWTAISVFVAVAVFVWSEIWKTRDRNASAALAGILVARDLEKAKRVLEQGLKTLDPGGLPYFSLERQPELEEEKIRRVFDEINSLSFESMSRSLADLVALSSYVSQPAARCLLEMSEVKDELYGFLDKSRKIKKPRTLAELGAARSHMNCALRACSLAIEAADFSGDTLSSFRLWYFRKYGKRKRASSVND